MSDQREDLHNMRYPPGSVITYANEAASRYKFVTPVNVGINDLTLTPEQIVRMAIREASVRGDFNAIANLALSLDKITS